MGGLVFDVCLAVHTEDLAEDLLHVRRPAVLPHIPPRHGALTIRRDRGP